MSKYRLPKESHIADAEVAEEIGLKAIEEVIRYYNKMLSACLLEIRLLTGKNQEEIREKVEEELGLLGTLERNQEVIKASSDVLKQILQEMEIVKRTETP